MRRSIFSSLLSSLLSSLALLLLMFAPQARAQDFDGDHLGDLSLYDPSRAVFLTRYSSGANVQQTRPLGGTGDVPAHGDFLGNGISGIATFDRSTGLWNILRSDSTSATPIFDSGTRGDLPVVGHFRGAACEEIGTYSIRNAQWTISDCSAPTSSQVTFGDAGAIPVVGNWDGDSADELGTFDRRNGRWVVGGNLTGGSVPGSGQTFIFGQAGDIPVPADYDGDGDLDAAFYRPSDSRYYVRDSATGLSQTPIVYGGAGDVPQAFNLASMSSVPKADLVMYRPKNGRYYIKVDSSAFTFNDIGISYSTFTPTDSNSPAPAPTIGLPLSLNSYAFGVTPGDLNRNRFSDFIFIKTVNGVNEFNALDPDGSTSSTRFGLPTDTILMGDTDGDLRFENIVVRNSTDNTTLNWYARALDGVAINTNFGQPGDTPLVGDLDCDGKDDLAVVRKRAGGYDWYVRQSSGGLAGPIQFGLETDAAYITDTNGDGCEDMVVAQNRFGGIFWFTRDFSTGAVTNLQWGLQASDTPQPPMDFDGDGTDDFNIVRTSGTKQTAYIRFANGTSKTLSLGDTSMTPFAGNFSGLTNAEFATYDASSGGLKIRRLNGVNTDLKTSASSGAIKLVRPYGSTVNVTGSSGGGGTPPTPPAPPGALNCTSTRSISGIGNGFVYKPVSDSDRKLVIVYEFGKTFTSSDIYSSNGTFIERGRYVGQLNGGRSHHRFSKSGSQYPNGAIIRDSSGRCLIVPNTAIRYG